MSSVKTIASTASRPPSAAAITLDKGSVQQSVGNDASRPVGRLIVLKTVDRNRRNRHETRAIAVIEGSK
jgi:hypothetical protein